MTDQRNGGHTRPAFAFIDEPTPGTSREGGEDASGTSDEYTTCLRLYLEAESEKPIRMPDPTICDGYINDAWKALNSRTDASDVNDASDSGSTNYVPVVTTGRADHAWPSTSRAGIEKVSSTTKDMASSSDDAWRYQLNTERRPIIDLIYKLDGAYSSGSPSHLHLEPTSSIDPTKHSTSRTGMVEASASLPYGARNAPGTGGREQREMRGVCGKVSSRPDALHGHAKEHTDDTAQICKACDQSSVKMSKSVEHFRNPTGKKDKCETCGKQFHQAYDLAEHQCTHADETPYKFEICEKLVRQAGHQDDNKRTHTGEKPYLCKTCGKTYKFLASLRKHEHTHAKENHHACQKCAKLFENKYDLKRHVYSQCGNSAYICEICDRLFMHSSSLLRHRRTKHVDKTPYEGTQCGCRFADKETRDRHVCQKERRM
ncbi:zinc finger protein 596-like isoform X1 [Dermacentor albipictus]|uniref:zinc finger protein 596-like isoform X1 n=1 Tax=Dermacentor albipictus TaxID=60249 RepID=UPI0038FBF623